MALTKHRATRRETPEHACDRPGASPSRRSFALSRLSGHNGVVVHRARALRATTHGARVFCVFIERLPGSRRFPRTYLREADLHGEGALLRVCGSHFVSWCEGMEGRACVWRSGEVSLRNLEAAACGFRATVYGSQDPRHRVQPFRQLEKAAGTKIQGIHPETDGSYFLSSLYPYFTALYSLFWVIYVIFSYIFTILPVWLPNPSAALPKTT